MNYELQGGNSITCAAKSEPDGGRDPLTRYLLDPVLPLLALLCMSALTVATIVLLAVTTAEARFGHGSADTRFASGVVPIVHSTPWGPPPEAFFEPTSLRTTGHEPFDRFVDAAPDLAGVSGR